MQPFWCSVCGQLLFFENSVCLQCGSELGFDPARRTLVTLTGTEIEYQRCRNQHAARCNWLVPPGTGEELCLSCGLTTIRPNDADDASHSAFADAESAKRRLLHQLLTLGLPVISHAQDPEHGLAFELLSAREGDVITGHEAGVITLDLSESDDAHREFVRQQLGEAYRTVLGHFRHEIGHYYWPSIVVQAGQLDEFRSLFGDETQSYETARQRHYDTPAGFDPAGDYVSQYATMHPWEDWAETFAHYLHIRDGLDTAAGYGLAIDGDAAAAAQAAFAADANTQVAPIVTDWLRLTIALNAMSRSIGQGELYPFVLSPGVVRKLDFVHRAVTAATRSG
ncbi:UNVERIFIED_CONTAM: hypothetical protein GTU68_003580 [Idotea baltica]|nr:hypothetical protein [Idotea baltica]